MLTVGSNMVIVSLHIYCERNGIPLCLSLSYYPVLLYYITKNLLLRNVILFFLLTFATLKVTISILPYLLRNVCINYNIFIIIQNMFLSPVKSTVFTIITQMSRSYLFATFRRWIEASNSVIVQFGKVHIIVDSSCISILTFIDEPRFHNGKICKCF